MQQFKTLFLKEFRGYFRSLLAYIVFFIYLFVSVGSAFYFGEYLDIHGSSLYSLFYLQPIILAVLIPAISMRLWAEEYRSGTAEFILTQPVRLIYLVLAKYTAVFMFFCLMSLFLLPFILYGAGWLVLDWQNICMDYAGLWLVTALFCALGGFISAFSRSMTLAYLLGVFFAAIFVALPYFYLYAIYNNFLFAEVGVPDVLYFVLLTGAFIVFNIEIVKFRQSVRHSRYWKLSLFIFLVLSGIALLEFALTNIFTGKADLTQAKFYTPKQETRQLLKNLKNPVSIDIFAAKDYVNGNVDYFHYVQQIQRLLKRYAFLSQGMVTVNMTYVEPYSALETDVLEKGLYFETNNKGSRDYFGAVIRDESGREEVIKQFLIQRRPFAEKDIDVALLKLTEPERVKTIGVYLDNTQNLDGFRSILLNLENDYNVFSVSSSMYDFSNKVDMVILINPKDISMALRYGLDQFVLRGGKLVIFFDFYTESQSELTNMEDLQIVDFLNHWRVALEPEMVDNGKTDEQFCRNLPVLRLNKAAVFKVKDNPAVTVKPFIVSEKGLLGAVLEGTFTSLYQDNPYRDTEIFSVMPPFLSVSKTGGQVAVVSDVDMLEDKFWVSDNSPDFNPYSIIEKSGNARAFRSLIDYMLGNEIYEKLPLNEALLNRSSISQQIWEHLYNEAGAAYIDLQNNVAEQRRMLYESSGGDASQLSRLWQISQAGQQLAQDEKRLQNIEYGMKTAYSSQVIKMMLGQIVLLPLFLVLLLAALLKWRYVYNNRKMEEKYHV